jgi:glutamate synthase (ferredoxin)
MSGGVAYVLDAQGTFPVRCNKQMVDLEPLQEADDIAELKTMLERHAQYTASPVAERILSAWKTMLPKFVKVIPKDYKRVLEAEKRVRDQGLTGEEAVMAAFQANVKDVARVGGN